MNIGTCERALGQTAEATQAQRAGIRQQHCGKAPRDRVRRGTHLEVHADGRPVPRLLVVDARGQLHLGTEGVLCAAGEALHLPQQLMVLRLVPERKRGETHHGHRQQRRNGQARTWSCR